MVWKDINTDVMKELPYYKSIVKHVLQQQVQHLLEEMSLEVGEESLIMTVNPKNGTISHHGSQRGKAFLQNRDNLKTQFLAFCVTSNSQLNPSKHGQCGEPSGKRKNLTPDSLTPDSQSAAKVPKKSMSIAESLRNHRNEAERMSDQRIASETLSNQRIATRMSINQRTAKETLSSQSIISYKHPYLLRKTGRSLKGKSLLKKLTSKQNTSKKAIPYKNVFKNASSNQNMCKKTTPKENVSTNSKVNEVVSQTTNHDHPPHVLPSPPRRLQSVSSICETVIPGLERLTAQQVKDDHSYYIDLNSDEASNIDGNPTRTIYNDKESLTKYYCGFSTDENQPLSQEVYEIKQEEEPLIEYVPYHDEIAEDSFDAIENRVQEDASIGNCETSESISIQLNGADINFRIPELQPIVCLETFNPCEKQINNLNGSNDSATGFMGYVDQSHMEESCGRIPEDLNQSEINSNTVAVLGTPSESNFVEAINEGLKEEPLCESDSSTRTFCKHEVSSDTFMSKEGVVTIIQTRQGDCSNKEDTRNKDIKATTNRETDAIEQNPDCNQLVCSENSLKDGKQDVKIEDNPTDEENERRHKEEKTTESMIRDTRHSSMLSSTAYFADDEEDTFEDESNKENDTKIQGVDETVNQEISTKDLTRSRSGRPCIKIPLKDFIGEDDVLEEIDDTLEIFECLNSETEWKQSDDEESSSDDEQNVDDDTDGEVVTILTKNNSKDKGHAVLNNDEMVTDRLKKKLEKFIYDKDGNILGRNLKDEDRITCIKNNDIYIRNVKENPNTKDGRTYDDNFHLCIYCKKVMYTLWRHLPKVHKNEAAVKEILTLKADLKLVEDSAIKSKMEKIIALKQQLLRKRSNHEHNLKVMKAKRGELILRQSRVRSHRLGKRNFNSELFGPCPECFDWMELKIAYARHRQICSEKSKATVSDTIVQNLVIQGKILASTSKDMQTEVFPLMPNDRLTKTAKSDPLIIALGEYHIMNRHGRIERRGYHASYRMRVAARLVHLFRKEIKSETSTLSDCLQVKYFDLVAKCAIQTAGKNSQKEFQHSKFGKQLGLDLFCLISAKIGSLQRDQNAAKMEDAKKFHALLQEKWLQTVQVQQIIIEKEKKAQQKLEEEARRERIKALLEEEKTENTNIQQSLAENSTSIKHDKESILVSTPTCNNKPFGEKSLNFNSESRSMQKLSEGEKGDGSEQNNAYSNKNCVTEEDNSDICEKCDPEDFVRLSRYLIGELEKPMTPDGIFTPEKYRFLVSMALACLVLYNSCDADKIRFLKVETFRRKLKLAGEAHISLYLGITDLERELLKTHHLIELRSAGTKRWIESKKLQGHKLPIILPTGMADLLKHLTDFTVRQTCFVESENTYLFATFDSELEPMGLQAALDVVRKNADLNKPSAITVKNLKKYTSTICQVSSVTEDRLLEFVQEMGFIEKLNLEEGQSISGINDRLEIAKLIFLQEQGKTQKLRTLQEISFDEIEGEKETKDSSTICDLGSDEEDDIGGYLPKRPRKKKSQSKGVPVRIPWSKVENEEIHKYFEHYITLKSSRACPGRSEILRVTDKSKKSNGEIWKRDWIAIKSKVANIMKKSKKQLSVLSSSEESGC